MTRPSWTPRRRAPCIAALAALTAAMVGCGEQTGETDTDSADLPDEPIASAGQALQPATCVTVRRGVQGDVHDAFLSEDYPYWMTGTEQSLWTGLSSGGN